MHSSKKLNGADNGEAAGEDRGQLSVVKSAMANNNNNAIATFSQAVPNPILWTL
jgi:hypothetical protein